MQICTISILLKKNKSFWCAGRFRILASPLQVPVKTPFTAIIEKAEIKIWRTVWHSKEARDCVLITSALDVPSRVLVALS